MAAIDRCGHPVEDGTVALCPGSFPAIAGRQQKTTYNLIRYRVTLDTKPSPAALGMIPEFLVRTAGVGAIEKVIGPLSIAQRIRIGRPYDARFTAITEFGLGAFTAPRTLYQQHMADLLNVRRPPRRVRRSGHH
jgi:hypothetical protein